MRNGGEADITGQEVIFLQSQNMQATLIEAGAFAEWGRGVPTIRLDILVYKAPGLMPAMVDLEEERDAPTM